jgi:hypothetical protein
MTSCARRRRDESSFLVHAIIPKIADENVMEVQHLPTRNTAFNSLYLLRLVLTPSRSTARTTGLCDVQKARLPQDLVLFHRGGFI